MIGSSLAGRYELLSELGRGGMAVVYRARDPRLDREVAVKLVAAERLAAGVAERFQREAELIASLDHPSIVPIYDFGHDGRWLFFVMPVLHGANLHQLMRRQRLVLGTTLEIAARTAEALAYSASQGIVHRDIKPENVMVALDEEDRLSRLWVMDFGLAVGDMSSRLTRTGNLPGTLAYLSPEQIVTGDVDGRSDLYSLGVILYECLAGRPPFTGSPASVLYRIVHEEPPSLLPHGVDERLESLVFSCLCKHAEDRLDSGDTLATALRDYARSMQPGAIQRLPGLAATDESDELPLVGRGAEIASLELALSQALDGACQLMLIGGERGFGTSRLCKEAESAARPLGFQVLRGRFSGHSGGPPYEAFGELIFDFFTQRRSSTSVGNTRLPDLSDLAPELLRIFPILRDIKELSSTILEQKPEQIPGQIPEQIPAQIPGKTAGEAAPSGSGEAGPEEDPRQIFELIAKTLSRLAGEQPQALVIEQLQTADASVQLLLYLVRRLSSTRTFIVGTYRPSGTSREHPLRRLIRGLGADPRCHHIALQPLDEKSHRKLIEHLLGGGRVDSTVCDRLYEVTGGNPLFAQEVVRSLWDAGDLEIDGTGHWRLEAKDALARQLPETVQQAVVARLERLGDQPLGVLGAAAVLGPRFRFRDLEDLWPNEGEDIESSVDYLIQRGLLREVPRTRGDQLFFESPLVREVVYSRLPRRRRRRLHRRLARRLESRAGEPSERSLAALLHHFAEGDVPERAVHYGRLQAQRSLDNHCWDDAEQAARLALEFTDDVAHAEGELRLMLAVALDGRGLCDAALREAARSVDAFQNRGEVAAAARAAATLVEVAWKNRRMDEVVRWLEIGLALARDAEVPETLVGLLHLAATAANLRGEQPRARRYLDEARGLLSQPHGVAEEVLETDRDLRVGLVGQLATTDPALATSVQEAEVLANIFEPLVEVGVDGRAIPRLARSLSSTEDQLIYTVQLRGERFFSDGSPVDAVAVKKSIEEAGRLGARRLRPMLSGLVGGGDFLAGRRQDLEGVRITGELELNLELVKPMPLLPALLSALGLAIAARRGGETFGSGPYRLTSFSGAQWLLERNPNHPSPGGPRSLEFNVEASSRRVAAGLLEGRLDLGRDLAAPEIEDFLARPTFHQSVHEKPLPNIAFLMLNRNGPATRDPRLRRILVGVIEPREVVWRSLGRFALPAGCWIPPGVLGHDPDAPSPRRIDRFEALGMLQDLDPQPLQLKALVHPIFRQRFRAVLEMIAAEWSLLGLDLRVEELPLADAGQLRAAASDTDLLFARWYPDYPDPDAYTYPAFSLADGMYGSFAGSPEIDDLLDRGRQEIGPAARERLYRRLQRLWSHEDVIVPLFHEVEFRVASPALGAVPLLQGPPYVDYRRLGWHASEAPVASGPRRLGRLRLPLTQIVETLDPAILNHSHAIEVMSSVFECLTRIDRRGAVVPHLAASLETSAEGRCHRFELREARFHDGRRLRAQDVRYTFQRVLRRSTQDGARHLEAIEGVAAFQSGQSDELAGFILLKEDVFELRLSRRIEHFPVFLSDPSLSIVPEGAEIFTRTWRDGCVGTGPFRVVGFEPERRIELAANPDYWRPGRPQCQGLLFERPVPGSSLAENLASGRCHVTLELSPAEIERFAADQRFAGGIIEHPAFATFFLLFNRVQGPLTDLEVRRQLCCHVDRALGRSAASIGRLGVLAQGLIPPGLLAHPRGKPPWLKSDPPPMDGLRLETAVHPLYLGQYEAFWTAFAEHLEHAGIVLEICASDLASMKDKVERRAADVVAGRWAADSPDPSSFAGIVYSDSGWLSRLICHERIDRLVERGANEADPLSRQNAYQELERQLANEALLWPLFHQQICGVAHPDVEGLRLGFGWPTVAYDELSLRR